MRINRPRRDGRFDWPERVSIHYSTPRTFTFDPEISVSFLDSISYKCKYFIRSELLSDLLSLREFFRTYQ
nr:unnamed protein product [Haemonchus contortus]